MVSPLAPSPLPPHNCPAFTLPSASLYLSRPPIASLHLHLPSTTQPTPPLLLLASPTTPFTTTSPPCACLHTHFLLPPFLSHTLFYDLPHPSSSSFYYTYLLFFLLLFPFLFLSSLSGYHLLLLSPLLPATVCCRLHFHLFSSSFFLPLPVSSWAKRCAR